MKPKIRLKFKARDLWVGAYVDTDGPRIYLCPLPMICVTIEPRATKGWERNVLERWYEGGKDSVVADFKAGMEAYRDICRFGGHHARLRDQLWAGYFEVERRATVNQLKLEGIPW